MRLFIPLTTALSLLFFGFAPLLTAQTFTNGNNLLQGEYHSGGCVGFTDMDGDGFDDLVEALLGHEKKVYTKKGRLNKSGTCRVLGWKPKELEDILAECRELLRDDFSETFSQKLFLINTGLAELEE